MTDGQQAALRFEPYLAGMDVMMWAVNDDPRVKLGIISIWLLDRPVSPGVFRAAVARAVAAGPPLRQVLTRAPLSTAPPRFVDDPAFDLAYHTPVIAAPGRGSLADLLAVAGQIGAAGFDYHRPLWEFSLVTGLEGGGCAIVQKVHHVLTDGVGGLAFLIGPLLAL
ncbi:MAG TPA: wax ester/triacylglycerol synthase domain-containing protein, partial [Streptosporangiaceae bacterium]